MSPLSPTHLLLILLHLQLATSLPFPHRSTHSHSQTPHHQRQSRRILISSSLRPGIVPRSGPATPLRLEAHHHLPGQILRHSGSGDHHPQQLQNGNKKRTPVKGHDANGFDDGSWRGNGPDSDYGRLASVSSSPANSLPSISSVKPAQPVISTTPAVGQRVLKSSSSTFGTDKNDQSSEDEENDDGLVPIGESQFAGDDTSDDGTNSIGKGGDRGSDAEQISPTTKHGSSNTTTSSKKPTSPTSSSVPSKHTNAPATPSSLGAKRSSSPSQKPTNKAVKSTSKGSSATKSSSHRPTSTQNAPRSASTGGGSNVAKSSPPSQSSASTPKTDCDILSSLYTSLGGPSWLNKSGWEEMDDSGDGCCEFYGVKCTATGRVSALDLAGNGLNGILDDRVFNLGSLVRLNLSSNSITGTVPDMFNQTPLLSSVQLSSNLFTGPLPSTLINASSLASVNLANNSFSGPLSFPNAVNLTNLYAGRNIFDGELDLSNNINLVKVAVDYNSLRGSLPDFGTMKGLVSWDSARNMLSGSVSALSGTSNLIKLDLSQNELSGSFPDPANLTHLTDFSIFGNSFSSPFPSSNAPPTLSSCKVDPVVAASCPPDSAMNSPTSLAYKCALKCRGGGKGKDAQSEAHDRNATGGVAKLGFGGLTRVGIIAVTVWIFL